jgi:hypothetical protein
MQDESWTRLKLFVIWEIILRDFWCAILRARASKRLANVRFSILNCYALTLKMC